MPKKTLNKGAIHTESLESPLSNGTSGLAMQYPMFQITSKEPESMVICYQSVSF